MSTVPLRADEVQPIGFWKRPFVQDVLPFLTSLVLHLGLIATGLLTYKAVKSIIYVSKVPIEIPTGTVLDGENIDHLATMGFPNGEGNIATQNLFKDLPADGISDKPRTSITETVALPGGGSGDETVDAIAVGPDGKSFGKGKGAGNGRGDDIGTGTDGGNLGLAPYDTVTRRPIGVPFMQMRGTAMKVVYLCDSSGSMMNKIDTLRMELRKAIDVLRPIQSFDLIFFKDDNCLPLDRQLMLALPETKRKAYDFLDRVPPSGSSDPIPGLRAAFAAQPELIYILTDGDFPNNQVVLEEVRKLNASKKVKINTIAFFDRGEEYEKLLKQIADENGGLFRFVSETDLQK